MEQSIISEECRSVATASSCDDSPRPLTAAAMAEMELYSLQLLCASEPERAAVKTALARAKGSQDVSDGAIFLLLYSFWVSRKDVSAQSNPTPSNPTSTPAVQPAPPTQSAPPETATAISQIPQVPAAVGNIDSPPLSPHLQGMFAPTSSFSIFSVD